LCCYVVATDFQVSVPLKEKKKEERGRQYADEDAQQNNHVLLAAEGQQLSLGVNTYFVRKLKVLEK